MFQVLEVEIALPTPETDLISQKRSRKPHWMTRWKGEFPNPPLKIGFVQELG